MIKFFILLVFFTKAYGNPFYPTVGPAAPVFNLPNNQIRISPWCPIGSGSVCASSLADQALLIPQASAQSYSIPLILLNNSSVKPSSNSYDRIFPTFGKKERKSSLLRASRSYYRNIDTGDIQIQESGKVIGEGPLVYVPIEDLQGSAAVKSPSVKAPTEAPPSVKASTEAPPSVKAPTEAPPSVKALQKPLLQLKLLQKPLLQLKLLQKPLLQLKLLQKPLLQLKLLQKPLLQLKLLQKT